MNAPRAQRTAPPPSLQLAVLLVLVALCGTAGCRGCGASEPERSPAQATSAQAPAVAQSTVELAAPDPSAPTTTEAAPDPFAGYPGPTSRSSDGWTLTTGFAGPDGKAITRPEAGKKFTVYATALDPQLHPIGQFSALGGYEMHGFLVALDLAEVLYTGAKEALREGADARPLAFVPGVNGSHALITAFIASSAPGLPGVRLVATSVDVTGPQRTMGPGAGGLTRDAQVGAEHLKVTTDPVTPIVGRPCQVEVREVDARGSLVEIRLPLLLVLNPELGRGEALVFDDNGKAAWTPRRPGRHVMLAPGGKPGPAFGFGLDVAAPP